MAQDFPNNPTLGQVFGSYVWNGTAWAGIGSANNLGVQVGGIIAREAYDYHPNIIINGGFDIWQRGTSATNNTGYLADRWYITQNATGASSNQSRVTTTLQGKLGYALRLSAGTNATSISEWGVRQPIERGNMETLAGKTVTLSFWYRSNRTGTHGARIIGLGTGSVDYTAGFTVSTADTWQRYSITTSAPYGSITAWSTTNPADIGSYVDIGFKAGNSGPGFTSINTNDYFEITGVQLEEGTVATPFRRAGGTIQGELAACQRYFTTSYPIGFTPGSTTYSGTVNGDGIYEVRTGSYLMAQALFHVPMRTAPTVTVYSPGTGAVNNVVRDRIGIQSTDSSSINVNDVSNKSAQVYSSSGIEACRIIFHYTANAEF